MHLNIKFSNDQDSIDLKFKLLDRDIVHRWVGEVLLAQHLNYSIDDPGRFYGFGSTEEETTKALDLINQSIDTINNYKNIIERRLESIADQDTLNYLHHIFEVYHGLLDTQHNNEFFCNAPVEVQRALADLNIHVHRCESTFKNNKPRAVVTYYGLPKTKYLRDEDFKFFTPYYQFGTVYLNYVEIGKTLEDLSRDNDQYIADDAFRPFKQFSADFNIKFYNEDPVSASQTVTNMYAYYDSHQDWFKRRGYKRDDPRLNPGQIPLATLDTDLDQHTVVDLIKNRQHISKIWFTIF